MATGWGMENRNKRKIVQIIYSTKTTPNHGLLSNVLQNTSITFMIKKKKRWLFRNHCHEFKTEHSNWCIYFLTEAPEKTSSNNSNGSKSERENKYCIRGIWKKKGIDDLIYKAEIETQTWRMNIWIPRGKEDVGWIGRLGLIYIHYWNYI